MFKCVQFQYRLDLNIQTKTKCRVW